MATGVMPGIALSTDLGAKAVHPAKGKLGPESPDFRRTAVRHKTSLGRYDSHS